MKSLRPHPLVVATRKAISATRPVTQEERDLWRAVYVAVMSREKGSHDARYQARRAVYLYRKELERV